MVLLRELREINPGLGIFSENLGREKPGERKF